MTRKNISDAVSNISTRHIEEANGYTAKRDARKFIIAKWGIAAACLCVIVGMTTVFAATGLGTRLISLFSSEFNNESDFSESGFRLSVKAEKIPEKAFTGEIREVHDILIQQFENYDLLSNASPGYWQKSFPSSEAARQYIGLDVLKKVSLELVEQKNTLVVLGDSDGRIHELILETDYTVGDIRMQAFSQVYSEYYEGDMTIGGSTTEYVEFTESFYTTAKQKQCHVISGTVMESEYQIMEGYMVEDGVMYHLNIAFLEQDAEQSKELLHQWADQF